MTRQYLRLELKEYNGPHSRFDGGVYAIWHNQETGQVTFRTECGFYKVPADVIESISFSQGFLPFDQVQPPAKDDATIPPHITREWDPEIGVPICAPDCPRCQHDRRAAQKEAR